MGIYGGHIKRLITVFFCWRSVHW